MPYNFPPEGSFLAPQQNNDYDNPPNTSSSSAYWRFQQATIQDRAFNTNTRRLQNYLDTTLNNWYAFNYQAGRTGVETFPQPPAQQWVGVIWDNSQFVDFCYVDRPEFPVCRVIEVSDGWWVNGTKYQKLNIK